MSARSNAPSSRRAPRAARILKSCCAIRCGSWETPRCRRARGRQAAGIEMVRVVWEFFVRADRVTDFEKYYASSGRWADLFRKSEGFRGTVLLRDTENARRFLTIDSWENASA